MTRRAWNLSLVLVLFSCKRQDPEIDNVRSNAAVQCPIPVAINPALDNVLEMGAQARQAAFHQAVLDWNAALGKNVLNDVSPSVMFVATQNTGIQQCLDKTDRMTPVFHHGGPRDNSPGVMSTAKDPPNPGPGWVKLTNTQKTIMSAGDSVDVDTVLATTVGSAPNFGPSEPTILWYTHLAPDNTIIVIDRNGMAWPVCDRIPWDYSNGPAVNVLRMDFYTVAAHELGHVLGYGHAPNNSGSVMEATLPPGTRRKPSATAWEGMNKPAWIAQACNPEM